MGENQAYLFMKRSQPEFIQNLFKKGEIYINRISYFHNCDNNPERTDTEEGSEFRTYVGQAEVKICEVGLDINKYGHSFQSMDVRMNQFGTEFGNIYSMSALFQDKIDNDNPEFTIDIGSFGESLIIIHHPQVFLERLCRGLKLAGFSRASWRRVAYYPDTYSGQVGIFKKRDVYSHQNEFRIHIPNEKNEIIKLQIGSLEDIAIVIDGAAEIKVEVDSKEKRLILPYSGC